MGRHAHILLWAGGVWYLGEGLLGPLFAVFAQGIGGDLLSITAAWASYLAVMGIATIAVGYLDERHARTEVLLILGYAANAVLTFAYLLVRTPSDLLLVQVGLGIASALATPTWDNLYARALPRHAAARMWAWHEGTMPLLMAVGVLMGGIIVTRWSFPTLFVTMGIVQVAATAYQARIFWS